MVSEGEADKVKVVPCPFTKEVTRTPVFDVELVDVEVLLNPDDVGVEPAVVLLTVIVVGTPEATVVRVAMVQAGEGLELVDVELELLLAPDKVVVLKEAAAGLARLLDRSDGEVAGGACAEIVLVIETGPLVGLTLDVAAAGPGSCKLMLVLRKTGSL